MTHTTLPRNRIASTFTLAGGDRCDYHGMEFRARTPDPRPAKDVRLVLQKMPDYPHLSPKNGREIKRMCRACRKIHAGQYIYPTDAQLGVFLLKELG